jgi:hypothetical protein
MEESITLRLVNALCTNLKSLGNAIAGGKVQKVHRLKQAPDRAGVNIQIDIESEQQSRSPIAAVGSFQIAVTFCYGTYSHAVRNSTH